MMTTEEWNDKPTGSNDGRTIIDPIPRQDAELPPRMPEAATIARLQRELAEAREKTAVQGALLEGGIRRVEKVETERGALIGAAYASGVAHARLAVSGHMDWNPSTVRDDLLLNIDHSCTGIDATAALDRLKAEAALAGWKRGREAAAAHMDNASANCRKHFTYPPKNAEQRDWQTGALLHANAATAIRAMSPPADLAARIAKEAGNE